MKKVLVADNLGFAVNQLYAHAAAGPLSFAEGWLAGLGFAMQIYFDFSGYSDIAIGLGLLFGIVIPDNFDAPYRTTCVIDFWRRWHMTLSRMLRDYLYISLGGSRYGLSRQVAALLVTMLLGGLWHGAGWTFVVWGGLHGLALAANHLWRRAGAAMPAPLGLIVTFLFVVAAFVIFRADSLATARHVLDAMAGAQGLSWQVRLVESGWRPPLFGSILNETADVARDRHGLRADRAHQPGRGADVAQTALADRGGARDHPELPDRRTRRRGRRGICLLPVLTLGPRRRRGVASSACCSR